MSTLLVGLGHKARHGKDEVAQALMRRLLNNGTRVRLYAFAAALKAWCRVEGFMEEKDWPLLQYVGTEMFRKRDPGIRVRALAYQITEERPEAAVITDMRFPNELTLVKKNGGIVVKVERYNPDGTLYAAPPSCKRLRVICCATRSLPCFSSFVYYLCVFY